MLREKAVCRIPVGCFALFSFEYTTIPDFQAENIFYFLKLSRHLFVVVLKNTK